jgi:hypothetical protein
MASQQPQTMEGTGTSAPAHTTHPLDEKFQAQHEEYEEKVQVKGDYSGAVAKTSPEEKKLVRKLDIWIMVSSAILRRLDHPSSNTD